MVSAGVAKETFPLDTSGGEGRENPRGRVLAGVLAGQSRSADAPETRAAWLGLNRVLRFRGRETPRVKLRIPSES
ncbi:hypothetical protein GCM10010249_33280 [Streptomyces roseolilacinus]|uniref:Uncharacterized protein n=1 Tax=Streptomyces roseolilacinus TaxID=66904 RepID=A0A918B4F3_9ACTN|nr:hypothetical protein GCM10010249_33280 [Streptomyces roseolilacinus]